MYMLKRVYSGFEMFMRTEQNKTAWMKNIAQEFTIPGTLVEIACSGFTDSRLECSFQSTEYSSDVR